MRRRFVKSLMIGAALAFAPVGSAVPAQTRLVAAEEANGASTLRRDDLRVAAVAYRLALAGVARCPTKYPLTGLLFHHLAEYEPVDRPLMVDRHALHRGPGILTVVQGSPAARAGLTAGDTLLSANGVPFPSGASIAQEPNREKWRRRTNESEQQLEDALVKGPVRLTVLRSGREIALTLDSVPGCLGRVRLARSSQVNAFATDRGAVMTTAMLSFLRSDDELAVVLGHELSHNILGHPGMRTEEGILASFGIKASNIWKREEAADRFGLRLMGDAGYNLDAAIPFWRRYLGKYDWFPQIFRSHPSLRSRERIATDEIALIRSGAAKP